MSAQMSPTQTQTHLYNVWDGCYATVIDRCRKGAYLKLDNGEDAFAFQFANLLPGSKVLCTVQKEARENRLKQVSIDSVVWHAVPA